MEGVSFFSESDMAINKDGKKKIASEYPIWYSRQLIDELKEDISMAEFELKSGRIKDTQIITAKDRLTKLQNRMAEVERSQPKLEGKELDKVAKTRKLLSKEISSKMYSRSDMKKGLVDAHEEVRRMTDYCIPMTPDLNEIALSCNVTPVDGKLNRTQAEKIWKITGRYLDESSNTESLRRD